MDLNLVSAFVRVVEHQSFTAAAKSLGLPKSSVSRRVTELEEALGVQLLHRTTRKLALTEAGRSYFEQAERALTELQSAAESAAGMDTEARGIVRVTAPYDVGVLALAEILAEFAAQYPDIHVDLSLSSKLVNLVDDGFDIGIRGGSTRDVSLVSRRVGSGVLGLYASPAYLEARGRPKALADLSQHDCVLFRGQHGRAIWKLEDEHGQPSSVEVRGHINVDELLFVRQAVGAGMGIGLLPTIVIGPCANRPLPDTVERVLPELRTSMHGEISVVTPSGHRRPRRVTLLRDFLVERLGQRCQDMA